MKIEAIDPLETILRLPEKHDRFFPGRYFKSMKVQKLESLNLFMGDILPETDQALVKAGTDGVLLWNVILLLDGVHHTRTSIDRRILRWRTAEQMEVNF